MTERLLRSDGIDSGISTSFWVPLTPYGEEKALLETFPRSVLHAPEGVALAQYYGLPKDRHHRGVGPSWTTIAALLDAQDGETR